MHRNNEFGTNENGATAILFSVSLLGLFCCAGVGIDMGMNQLRLTQVQEALDSAVIVGASTSLDPVLQKAAAKTYFDNNIRSLITHPEKLEVSFSTKGTQISGSVKGKIPTYLLSVVGKDEVAVNVRSTATASISYEPACFMAMHPTRKHTLELNGSVSVFAPNCNIYGNSNHPNDVVDPHTSANFLTGRFVGAVGGGHHFIENVTPPVEFGTELVVDPLLSLAMPVPGACITKNKVITKSTEILPPGNYCGGLKIINSSNVTLQTNGVYFISGGDLQIDRSQLSGENVTVFLTDASTNVDLKEAKLSISGPKTGDFAGIAVYGARVTTHNLFEDSEINVHGVFYMPMGELIWDNQGSPAATAKWTTFFVDGVSWNGSGTITMNFDLSNNESDVPYPAQLVSVPRPGSPRLVK